MTPRQSSSTILRQLADLSDIRGDSTDAADLRRAAGALDSHPAPRPARLNLALERRLFGKAERSTANSALTATDLEMALRTRLERVPWLLRRLVEWAVASTSETAALARAGIATLPDLTTALDEGLIARPLGVEIDGRVRAVVDRLSAQLQPITLGRACAIVDPVLEHLTAVCPALENATASGGMRRCEPLVESLIIVGCAAEPQSVIDVIAALPEVDDVLHRTGRRVVFAHKQTEIDVRIAPADQYGSVLYATTGCRAHLAAMAARQTRNRLFSREEDVYANSGLPFIAAELRQGTGEIEAAAAGRLPSLISLEQIRGDLHMHSTYSDGQDALEVMVAASSALGYEYIAVTDHSERAGAARTVTRDTLARQRDEIARLRERYPSIAILHGIEVDIMPNGRLDFPDSVLETLDIVLASLHDDARHDARRLTRRCVGAIRHPLVSIITHPANRIVGRRSGYPLDFEAIYSAAAETGTALEIDGAPAHLDLDGEHARAATAAGVTLVIDSDCHRASALERQMQLGVGTARRGWVETRHVLNARSLTEVRRFIANKRVLH